MRLLVVAMSDASSLLRKSIQLVNDGVETHSLELVDRGLAVLAVVESLSGSTHEAVLQGLRGEYLIQRWQISAVRADLDRAIDLLIRAGSDTRDATSHELAVNHLYTAARVLVRRFRRRRRIADIDNAILRLEQALSLVADRPSEDFAEMEILLSNLREIRAKAPMMVVQSDVGEADREDLSSPYSMANMIAWNEGTPRFSGLEWVHSSQDGVSGRDSKGADLSVLFLRTFKDDETNFVILNTLALAMEGGSGRIDIVSDLRDRQQLEDYWRQAFGNNRSLFERIDFTAAESNTWRKHVLRRMAQADVILLNVSPKDIDFPEFPFAPPRTTFSWDEFMDSPFIKPITGAGLLREVSYLNRMRKLPRTVVVCDEHYHMTFDDLIALGGMIGDATDMAGNFVTPRLTALDKQVGYLAKAYRGITFLRDAGETVLPALAASIREVLGSFRTDDGKDESVPWQPQDLCGCSSLPRRLPPDNELKLISFTDVEDVLFLPSDRITEIEHQGVLAILNAEAIRIGCPYCHAPLERLFFYINGLHQPKWPQEAQTVALRAICQICGHRASLVDDVLQPQ